ncbi:MAG: MOSC domain-containing protein [Pseudomonadota bacterium]
MTAALRGIWRHPIKALSREGLDRVTLSPGSILPYDRHWAVTHELSRPGDGWVAKRNFLRGVTGPQLMAVTAVLDEASERVTLRHPDKDAITFAPEDPADTPGFLNWITPLWPEEQPRPTGIAALATGFTDVPEPWVAINNLATHRAVAGQLEAPDLSAHRWRGNLWLDGFAPWDEFDWTGRQIRIGDAVLEVRQRITRCKATMANPETGHRDHDTLAALRHWGHQDFGIYAEVVQGGTVALGDAAALL